MKKFLVYILVLVMILCSCGQQGGNQNTPEPNNGENTQIEKLSAKDFVFTTEKGSIELNKEFKPDAFGEYEYYEAASCGYEGLDKIYTYASFEVYTYPDGDHDYVSYIDLFDGAQTARGVKLGDKVSVLSEKYGDDCSKASGLYVYSLDDDQLLFTVENDVITEIEIAYNGK